MQNGAGLREAETGPFAFERAMLFAVGSALRADRVKADVGWGLERRLVYVVGAASRGHGKEAHEDGKAPSFLLERDVAAFICA